MAKKNEVKLQRVTEQEIEKEREQEEKRRKKIWRPYTKLEERLRRYHTKQMTNQLDKLGILTNTPQQLQAKSLNSTPFDKKQLTHLSEDEEEECEACGS